jgi:hypothetical protein
MITERTDDATATNRDSSDEDDRAASERLERVVAVVSIGFTVL